MSFKRVYASQISAFDLKDGNGYAYDFTNKLSTLEFKVCLSPDDNYVLAKNQFIGSSYCQVPCQKGRGKIIKGSAY